MHEKNQRDGSQDYELCPKENLEKVEVSQRWPLLILSVAFWENPVFQTSFSVLLFTFFMNGFHSTCLFGNAQEKKKQE